MVNTGQMLMVLGALVLFSLALPSLNNTILYNDRTLITTNAELTAISLAQKIISEAGSKAFDEVCLATQPYLASQLTAVGSLGAESGESYSNYDDLDDYNSLSLADSTTLPSVLFNITATVDYVNTNDPSQVVGYRTFMKRLLVTITGPYLVNPANNSPTQIVMEQGYSYY